MQGNGSKEYCQKILGIDQYVDFIDDVDQIQFKKIVYYFMILFLVVYFLDQLC